MKTEAPYKTGDRLRLISMPDEPNPVPTGTKGTVFSVIPYGGNWILNMKWDNGRTLGVHLEQDTVEKID
jgi:hypothetical protein